MSSRFFIDRPVFAAVISIVIVLAGALAIRALPIAQYPELVPPQVVVSATYPGASAETLAQTVAAPLEQQINGVEGMLYMQSTNFSSGTMQLTVTFALGTDPDQAAIDVNNRVQRATSTLPGEVTRQGVTVAQALDLDPWHGRDVLRGPALRPDLCRQLCASQHGRRTQARSWRCGRVRVRARATMRCGSGCAPTGSRSSASRVRDCERAARAEFTVRGRQDRRGAGRRPVRTSSTRSRRVGVWSDGGVRRNRSASRCRQRLLRLKDVARIELGAQSYDTSQHVLRRQPIGLATYMQSGGNALEVAGVREKMEELRSVPARRRIQNPIRSDALRRGFDQGSDYDPAAGHGTGDRWSCSCSCSRGARRSSRSSRCRYRSSARSPACGSLGFRSIR